VKCKYCPSQEELKWPENYKKGDKPINRDNNQPHTCIETPKNKHWKKGSCRNCNIQIDYNPKYYDPSGLCEDCKGKEDHDLMFK